MILEDLSVAVSSVVLNSIATFVNFIPALVGGLIVLIIGLVVSVIVYRAVFGVLKVIQLEKFLAKYGIVEIEGRDVEWSEILAELARWTVIIVFLVPTLSAWKLGAVNTVLNRVILYIPNVIVAVILAMVGLVIARLAYRIAHGASNNLGKGMAHTIGLIAQWSVMIFVGFLVLHQLGVAQEMLRILFGGIVAMFALAGGLAFGFGGQDTAKQITESIWSKFKK
ncbi:MAG: Conserved TM helix repeat-containing protein [Candidatus Curtissbacteria bacterium GW2011_GWA1_40_9]|uniref:Conserved TM helix repeat-containing protein n=1 Tax=Candidatus Curtissbacteria bacterium GW2011_GWA1_40_9 TaxID=1618408 RepID=A0A0G0TMB8_9BACT|nr:MAG: Conserved TM helix repeat-containing protein [Candidatus Curtissbacteria bacterium GW2011_GWA1_40_9]